MRSLWSGAISFGLIYIPVKVYNAARPHTIDLDLLRKSDHCPIKYSRVCRNTGEEVPYKEIVRGYQYKKGDYVVLDDEDFRRANVHKSDTIEIEGFVNDNEIDDRYIEKPYYLEPKKEAKRTYTLLREALRTTGKVGVGRFVMRTREHIGCIKADENVLILNQMRFANDIRPSDELDLPERGAEKVNKKELDLAMKLIEQLSEPWQPDKYYDTYNQELKRVIKEKVEGKTPEPAHAEPVPGGVQDLFTQLNESLELVKHKQE
jgi:DNA end-binding protein Ku